MTSNDFKFGSSSGSSAPSAGTDSYERPSLYQPMSDSSDSEDDHDNPTQRPIVVAGGEPSHMLELDWIGLELITYIEGYI